MLFLIPFRALLCRVDELAVVPEILDAGGGGDEGHQPAERLGDEADGHHAGGAGERGGKIIETSLSE